MHCLICKSDVNTFETSVNVQTEKGNRMKDINLHSVPATSSMGGGLNQPQSIKEKPYKNFISCL